MNKACNDNNDNFKEFVVVDVTVFETDYMV